MLERGRLERLTNRRVLITIIIIMAGFKGAQASHQAADFFYFAQAHARFLIYYTDCNIFITLVILSNAFS